MNTKAGLLGSYTGYIRLMCSHFPGFQLHIIAWIRDKYFCSFRERSGPSLHPGSSVFPPVAPILHELACVRQIGQGSDDIATYIQDETLQAGMETFTKVEKNRDRIEKRTGYIATDISWLPQKAEMLHKAALNTVKQYQSRTGSKRSMSKLMFDCLFDSSCLYKLLGQG